MGGSDVDVLQRSGRRCCLCYGLSKDLSVKKGQIAHLDRNPENNNPDNLAFLCLVHHDEYDTRPSQSKGWTVEEAKQYRNQLYKTIEELQTAPQRQPEPIWTNYKLPICKCGYIPTSIAHFVDVTIHNSGERHHKLYAKSLVDNVSLTLNITNPNQYSMLIHSLYIDVIKYLSIDIAQAFVFFGDMGGGAEFRYYRCDIEPSIGTYECLQLSNDYDFIKLKYGEMETFRFDTFFSAEGIYHLRLGMKYSIGDITRNFELDNDIYEIAIFDPVLHYPIETQEP